MNLEPLSIACVTSPLVGFAIAILALRKNHAGAAGIVIASGVVSLLCSLLMLINAPGEALVYSTRWFMIGDVPIGFGQLIDGRTMIMGSVVALITLCIQVYSLTYMKDDPGKGRFFAFLALFEWAMLSFVFATNLLQTFIFWELVGLASFLLIGFWYEKPSAVDAAKKAFIMTRIGDVGLFVGLILLFHATGTLDVPAINALFAAEGAPEGLSQGRIELIAALLFVGVIGKSAQFPLHTWLPDAMEGPTPVSALLHSATMVAAGVFLVARFHDVFLDAPATLTAMLWIATFTALLSSTMAMVAKDMKRVLAFSSISQLSFMLIGLAAGSLFAGFFHLTTHAFFKALLFLCAGSYIHAAGSNDLVAIGRSGAARKLPVTTVGLVVGGAALAGIPIFAGFFSKEQILGALHGPGHLVFKIGAFAAAFMTAYYTARMVLLVLRPNPDSQATPDEPIPAGHHLHAHEPIPLAAPIALLSVLALIAGFFGDQIGHALHIEHIHHPGLAEMAPAVLITLFGVALAWFDFGRKAAPQTGLVAKTPALQNLFERRWYLDEIYKAVFVRGAVAIAKLCFGTETKGLDAGVDAAAARVADAGHAVARGHTGRLQLYLGVALVAMVSLVIIVGAH